MNIFRAILDNAKQSVRSWAATDDRWYSLPWLTSMTGEKVNEFTAMQQSTVFACMRLLCETFASLPCVLYERNALGKDRAYGEPLYRLLHDEPNMNMTSFDWREAMLGRTLSTGNNYDLITKTNGGYPTSIIPLDPHKVTPMISNSGEIYYDYEYAPGQKRPYQQDAILHSHGPSLNGLTGMSVISQAANAIGLGISTERFGSSFFKNGARPGVALEHPGKLGDEGVKNIKDGFVAAHSGDNNLGVIVLQQGMKLNTYSIAPNDAQFLETRKFQVEDIARMFRIPLSLVGYLHAAFKSNVEQENIGFVVHSLRPWLVRIEQEMNKKLIPEKDRKRLFIEFNVDALLRGDSIARAQALEIQRRNAIISVNEWREKENMNPIVGADGKLDPAGNIYQVQNIWQNLGAEGFNSMSTTTTQEKKPAPVEPETKSAPSIIEKRSANPAKRNRLRSQFEPMIRDSSSKIVRIEVNDIRRAIKSHLSKRGVSDFNSWLDTFYADFDSKIHGNMDALIRTYGSAVAEAAANEVGGQMPTDKELAEYAKGYVDISAARHVGSSHNQIKKIIRETSPDELEAALLQRLDEWDETRADKMTMREKVEASDTFARMAWVLAGVTQMIWMAQGSDPCPYCEEMNGSVVGIEKVFVAAGDSVSPDGQEPMQVTGNTMHAPLHNGCVCTVVPG